jgi:hypothetical protein
MISEFLIWVFAVSGLERHGLGMKLANFNSDEFRGRKVGLGTLALQLGFCRAGLVAVERIPAAGNGAESPACFNFVILVQTPPLDQAILRCQEVSTAPKPIGDAVLSLYILRAVLVECFDSWTAISSEYW